MKRLNVHASIFPGENCPDLAVAILAGGASRRYGSDKALVQLCLNGSTVIERVADAGRSVSSEVFVVGHEWYAPLLPGVPIVPDEHPGEGPLGGILTALRHVESSRVLVLACDAPCLSSSLLRWMASVDTPAEVLIPRTSDGRWHPMPGIYRCSVIPEIEASLERGHRSVTSIFEHVIVQEISEVGVRLHDPELNSLFSLNQPQQLSRAKACVLCK